jgi:hypothetical protein
VHNVVDGGSIVVEIVDSTTHQRCEIPAEHQHVRYGLGWYSDPRSVTAFRRTADLFVCSDGMLVCTFSGSFMQDPDNVAIIVANALNNTMMPSGADFIDSARNCRSRSDSSLAVAEKAIAATPSPKATLVVESSAYRIDGWLEEWQAGFRLFGEGGHDWIVGGPSAATIYGGTGNDLLVGGESENHIFGEEGLDVMHGGNTGTCSGGSPAVDHHCMAGDPTVRWWPYEGTEAGDCCCHSCPYYESCFFTDMTPGVTSVDLPPTPW